jgi:nicotinamide phosphoribosyltransferase
MNIFPLHATDFYKTGHPSQYPEGTEFIYENFTCRSVKFFEHYDGFDKKVVFFGLQYVLKYLLQELWQKNFFNMQVEDVIERYQRRMDTALGPGLVPMEHIRALHGLGFLPVRIASCKA